MVLWEMTLATAYFLGLKRTYRLALKLQHRIVRRPKIRAFLRRRTRVAFDMALSVHKKVQQRDLEVGRSLGNWLLRWLDRWKPAAQIRASLPPKPPPHNGMPKHMMSSGLSAGSRNHEGIKIADKDSSRRLFSSNWTTRPRLFLAIPLMMPPPNMVGTVNQYRHITRSTVFTSNAVFGRGARGVFRRDIEQWMLRDP